jgi:hypothetical protein
MKRREFLGLAGGATVWPLATRAQPAMPVIGFLSTGGQPGLSRRFARGPWQNGLR